MPVTSSHKTISKIIDIETSERYHACMSDIDEASPSELNTEQLVRACRAIGDPLRMRIFQLLGQGSFAVLELCELLDVKQSSLSHHLKTLSKAGLVITQREGNSIYYRRPLLVGNDPWSHWLRTTMRAADQMSDNSLPAALDTLLAERAKACAEFFATNADAFREQQDLIASFEQYGPTLRAVLQDYSGDTSHALEIGPGDGALLPDLADHFDQVMALDIASAMLDKVKSRIQATPLTNVMTWLGDTGSLLKQSEQRYQLAVANMVLHHVPAPQTIFREVARLLAPGGAFLVTDLCRHDQHWAKESCGDLWLGFEPDDLTHWAEEAGLSSGQSQFLGLRNGFQIQFRLFYRT